MTRLRCRKFDFGGRKLTAEIFTNRKFIFPNSVPFSNLKFSEHKFNRLDRLFAEIPINQLIDEGMKPN